jgi:ABC-type antimicrobial peptide transport system permease subunit
METLIDSSMAGRRILARLTGAFSLFALLLAAIGLYGVISYATTRRARELSIRAAMGATRAGLVRLVLGQGLQNIGIGLLLGLSGAIPAARLLADQLFQVKPTDPAAYALAVSVLAGAAILATVLPARRAARINPAEVLRQD